MIDFKIELLKHIGKIYEPRNSRNEELHFNESL